MFEQFEGQGKNELTGIHKPVGTPELPVEFVCPGKKQIAIPPESGQPQDWQVLLAQNVVPRRRESQARSPEVKAGYEVQAGVLEINFQALWRMKNLPATDKAYKELKIDNVPQGCQILHWADENGYYFFFAGKDKQSNIYHYPRCLSVIEYGGQRYDVDRSRLKVHEYAMEKALDRKEPGRQNPFSTITDPKFDAVNYFKKMAKLSAESLTWQENLLRKGANNCQNPYFQIYLADVLTMEALKPLADGFLQTGQVSPEQKQDILKKLDEADKQLESAVDLSSGPLARQNKFPRRNAAMELAPGAYLVRPPAAEYYDPDFTFWGGAWDQASRRRASLAFIKGLIESEVYKYFELP